MDLYSMIKLRRLNGKSNGGTDSSLGSYNVKPMSSSSRKSKGSARKKSRMMALDQGKRLAEFKKRKSDIHYSDREGKGINFKSRGLTDEEMAIEVLGSLKVTGLETMVSEFKVGDLVWGKIETHPWWPGYIYDSAMARSSVLQLKTRGCLLVSFFGDNTYSWVHPKNLLPYEDHFLSKSKQSKSELFTKAVKEAIDEVRKREELALTCKCRKIYELGPTYPTDQVRRLRRALKPAEIVSFLHKVALGPMDYLIRDGRSERNVARILAYRKTIFAGDYSSYIEAHTSPDGWSDGNSNAHKEALPQGTVSTNISERVKVSALKGKRKGSASSHSNSGTNETCDKRKCVKTEESRIQIQKLATVKGAEAGAILSIKFPPQATLPSTSELKAKFARFGRLNTSATYSSWKSSECHISFFRTSDAESARAHLYKHGDMYNNTKVVCNLESLKVTASPKSLDLPMSLEKHFTDLKHLPSSSSEKDHQKIHSEVSFRQLLCQFTDSMNKKHLEDSQTAAATTTTITTRETSAADISGPMLKLLREVDEYVEDLKREKPHWLYGDFKKM